MSDLDLWSALVGFAAPLLIAALNHPTWPAWLKVAAAVVVSTVGGAVTAALTGNVHVPMPWLHSALVILVAATTFYHTVWYKPASQLERATALKTLALPRSHTAIRP